jgi:small subunit ribosomal protein S17e
MGNIKPTYIKRVAIDLIARYPDEFNHDYEHNKVKVNQLTDVSTTHMRNKVAGYITSIKGRSKES